MMNYMWNGFGPQVWSGMPWSLFGWPFIALLAVWSGIWTGIALWYAAKRDEKWWFILFLVVHTAGILEIIYLALVVKLFNQTHTGRKK